MCYGREVRYVANWVGQFRRLPRQNSKGECGECHRPVWLTSNAKGMQVICWECARGDDGKGPEYEPYPQRGAR